MPKLSYSLTAYGVLLGVLNNDSTTGWKTCSPSCVPAVEKRTLLVAVGRMSTLSSLALILKTIGHFYVYKFCKRCCSNGSEDGCSGPVRRARDSAGSQVVLLCLGAVGICGVSSLWLARPEVEQQLAAYPCDLLNSRVWQETCEGRKVEALGCGRGCASKQSSADI